MIEGLFPFIEVPKGYRMLAKELTVTGIFLPIERKPIPVLQSLDYLLQLMRFYYNNQNGNIYVILFAIVNCLCFYVLNQYSSNI